jgi:signal transduction histidine kinase
MTLLTYEQDVVAALAHVPVEVTSLATAALEDVQPLADERAQTLAATTCDEPLVVLGDGLRLKQVVINLLTNAVKYTSRDGRIGLTVAREGDAAVICVRDSGIGIRADMLARVFEPFQQARSGRISDGLRGIGIGLALARRIVELQHGTVEARSDGPGLGSEFIARLPCRSAESPP